jgi:Fe-S cluster biogenesis protein NfuA
MDEGERPSNRSGPSLTPGLLPGYIVVLKEMPMLNERVLSAIQDVRPSLQADGGDIELVSVSEDGIVNVRLTGACGTCPMSTMTLKMGVENYLKKTIPEVKEVVQVE